MRRASKWIPYLAGIFVIPAGVIFSIWSHYFFHLYARGAEISPEVAASLRQHPDESVLAEVARQIAVMEYASPLLEDPVRTASQLLAGEVTVGTATRFTFSRPFAPSDVKNVPPKWQLWFHGFAVPQIYLRAYQLSGEERYLEAARDYILSWADHEAALWQPEGLLWNDHAIAQRAHVLVAFWHLYRSSKIYSADTASRILRTVAKTGTLLQDPDLYVYRTNHGIMQDLALLQLRIAFPEIPGFERLGTLAYGRLLKHLPHYLDENGAILEHSAGYHELGVKLIGPILRDLTILGVQYSSSWPGMYQRAIDAYAMYRRPDGTLPRWGDTRGTPNLAGPELAGIGQHGEAAEVRARSDWHPARAFLLQDISGHAVWWRGLERWPSTGRLSQTLVTWSYFPPFGHKQPDELSLWIWARGTSWWTSMGYLDGDYLSREVEIESRWDWSNAPHLIGEDDDNSRHSTLLWYGASQDLTALDVVRRTEDGFSVRRQVIQSGENVWVVIDTMRDLRDRRARTVWLADPSITLAGQTGASHFRLVDEGQNNELAVTFIGSPDVEPEAARGRARPFLGWVSNDTALVPGGDSAVVPATALVVTQSSLDSRTIAVSALRSARTATLGGLPRVKAWSDAENWELEVPVETGTVSLARMGEKLVSSEPGHRAEMPLTPGRDVSRRVGQVLKAYTEDKAGYWGPVHEHWFYRVRMSLILFGVLLFQQAAMGALVFRRPAASLPLALSSAAGWTCVGLWLWLVYFRP
jgi:hypothetical protein